MAGVDTSRDDQPALNANDLDQLCGKRPLVLLGGLQQLEDDRRCLWCQIEPEMLPVHSKPLPRMSPDPGNHLKR